MQSDLPISSVNDSQTTTKTRAPSSAPGLSSYYGAALEVKPLPRVWQSSSTESFIFLDSIITPKTIKQVQKMVKKFFYRQKNALWRIFEIMDCNYKVESYYTLYELNVWSLEFQLPVCVPYLVSQIEVFAVASFIWKNEL